MIISLFDRVENIVGKGEIACTRLLSQMRQKVSLCGNGLNTAENSVELHTTNRSSFASCLLCANALNMDESKIYNS